jgi:hypothetical protein
MYNVFGVTDLVQFVSNGYIAIDVNSGITKGNIKETLLFHGTADKYEVNGAKTIADLFIDAHTKSGSRKDLLSGKSLSEVYDKYKALQYQK